MRRQRKPRSPLHRVVIFTSGILAIYAGYYWGSQQAPLRSPYLQLSILAQPQPLELRSPLRDQFGVEFAVERLRDHWTLLFFASTADPETARALFDLATRVDNHLADRPALQRRTRIVMVGADPRKDTPEALRAFMALYDESFLALTGATGEIDRLARRLGVKIRRTGAPGSDDYRVEHGTSLALIGPDARLAGLFTGRVDATSIATDLKRIAGDD